MSEEIKVGDVVEIFNLSPFDERRGLKEGVRGTVVRSDYMLLVRFNGWKGGMAGMG